jgi:hypothetical protein
MKRGPERFAVETAGIGSLLADSVLSAWRFGWRHGEPAGGVGYHRFDTNGMDICIFRDTS